MANNPINKDDMGYADFGKTYSYYEDQLDAIDKSLIYLGARENNGTPAEQPDILRLEAELTRQRGQISRQFDAFNASEIAVAPPSASVVGNVEDLLNKVEALTTQQLLANATLNLLDNVTDTVSTLVQG
jgi:hypothetical protein